MKSRLAGKRGNAWHVHSMAFHAGRSGEVKFSYASAGSSFEVSAASLPIEVRQALIEWLSWPESTEAK